MRDDAHLRAGLSTHEGMLTSGPVATALGLDWTAPELIIT